jgi:hypothetical protein
MSIEAISPVGAMKQALEYLDSPSSKLWPAGTQYSIITSLRQAIAEAEKQEPVAWMHSKTLCLYETFEEVPLADGDEWPEPLYTTPQPQREWVGLTDEERRAEFAKLYPSDDALLNLAENNRDFMVEAIGARHHWHAFQLGSKSTEAKLKEKNT